MEGEKNDIFEEQFELKQLINVDFIEDWEMRWKMCIVQLIYFIVHAMHLLTMQAILVCAPSDDGDSDFHWGNEVTNSVGNMDTYSTVCDNSNLSQDNQFQETTFSKGTKRKTTMIDLVESGNEKMLLGISNLIEVMQEGIALARKQVEIAKTGLAILEKSIPQYYSPTDVWSELDNRGVMQELRFQCYRFLCENENAKQQFFGVPQDMRWNLLYQLMKDAGIF